MTTAYTNLLGLALPVTGELSGTWGDTVNDFITEYLDASVAGTQTISGGQTAVTLSKTTNSALVQAGSGATGSSQYMVINCTGNPASMLTITAPAASKSYFIINATSTNQEVKIVGTGPTTGVTIPPGQGAAVAWNGSDFRLVGSTVFTNTANTFTSTQAFNGSASALATNLVNAAEKVTVSATAATGTINYDVTTQSVLYYTSNAAANWTMNFRASSGTTLNTALATGQSVTVVFMATQGSTAYFSNAVQVDGVSVTPRWQGGAAPTFGNANGIDVYSYTIIKTGAATFTVLASLVRFA